jgi:hypothetical protein
MPITLGGTPVPQIADLGRPPLLQLATNTSDPYIHLSQCSWLPMAAILATKSSGRKVRFLSIQLHSVTLDQSDT